MSEITKSKIKLFIAIAILGLIYFLYVQFNKKDIISSDDKPELILIREGDTLKIDISSWDSTDVDSFFNSYHHEPTTYEDSMYKVYGVYELDSFMDSTTPLIDSLLKEFDHE